VLSSTWSAQAPHLGDAWIGPLADSGKVQQQEPGRPERIVAGLLGDH
jgi:hypothetical protein